MFHYFKQHYSLSRTAAQLQIATLVSEISSYQLTSATQAAAVHG